MSPRLAEQKFFAVMVGWIALGLLFFLWSYVSYDLLLDSNKDWFYRVNVLLHDHPETGALGDPLFWLSTLLGNSLIFGAPSLLIGFIFVPKHGHSVLWLTVGIALVLSAGRKMLIWMSPTTAEIKVASVGDLLIGLAVVGLCGQIARKATLSGARTR